MNIQELAYWLYDYGSEACDYTYIALNETGALKENFKRDRVNHILLENVMNIYNKTYALSDKFEVRNLKYLFEYFNLKADIEQVDKVPEKGWALVCFAQYQKTHWVVYKDGKEVFSPAEKRYGFDYENYHNGDIIYTLKVCVSKI